MSVQQINKTYDIKSKVLTHKLDAAINAHYLKSVYDKKLEKIVNDFKLPGFRSGKVPKKLLNQRYGPSILRETAEEAVEQSLGEILEKEKLRVASQPKLDLKDVKIGNDLEYTAEFESMPTVKPIEFDKITIKAPKVELTDKDIETHVLEEIKNKPTWNESTKAIVDGVKVVVDFDGKVDGKPFDGGVGKDIEIIIGDGKFLKDFEKGVIGLKAGDNKEVDVVFPSDYHQKKLAGKEAKFDIKVNKVWAPKYHKIDKEWFKLCGSKAETKKAFLEEQRPVQERIAQQMETKLIKERVSDALTKSADFPIPQSLIDAELSATGSNEKPTKAQTEKAKSHVGYMLVIQNLVQQFDIQVTGVEVERFVDSLIPPGIDKTFFKSWYVQDKERVEKIKLAVLEEKVLDRVKDLCKLKEEKITLPDLKKALTKEKS